MNRFGWETRQCSPAALALPALGAAALLALAAVAGRSAPSHEAALVGLSKFVWVVALSQGLAAIGPLTGDPLVELHASTATPYRDTLLRRLCAVALVSLSSSVVLYLGMQAMGMWGADTGVWGVLNTFSGGAFLMASAYAARAVVPTASAVSMAVITAWLAMLLVYNRAVPQLQANRVGLLMLALGLVAIGHRRPASCESLIGRMA